MKADLGYRCKTCGKCYHKEDTRLPRYCKKCGEDLVEDRYWYNLVTDYNGNPVETHESNMFGGYEYIHVELTDSVEEIKLRRKFLFWWVPWVPKKN